MVDNEGKILRKDKVLLGKAGLFTLHVPTQGNSALCTSRRCLEGVSFIVLSAGFCTHGTSFSAALQLAKKMSFHIFFTS